MRITNSMISRNLLNNLNRNLEYLSKIQNQMSSGKTVSKPSDDPVNVARIMRLQSMVQVQEKYQTNMENAQGYIDNAESSLDTVSDVLNRARELAIDGANGDMSESDRLVVSAEVDELIDEILEVANSSFDGRYIFGGFKTEASPFSRSGDTITYGGDDGELQWEVAEGVTIPVNIPGDVIFGNYDEDTGTGSGVFDALVSLKKALENNDAGSLGGTVLGKIDDASVNISSQRAVYGARSNRLEVSQDRASQSNTNLTEVLSKLEDVDLAEASMNYSIAHTVYQAALETGLMVIQPTLLDYLE